MSLRNERRRRLLSDDSLAGESDDDAPIRLAADSAGESDTHQTAYAAAVRHDRQRAIHELLPSSYAAIGLVVFGGVALVGVVELLHVWSDSLADVLNAQEVLALSLLGARNVSHWLASTLLVVASLVAMHIYSLRRHRVDDYFGRYRVWLWTALGCMGASLAETAGLADLARGVCRRAAEYCSLEVTTVWPVFVGVTLTAIGIRLLFELRRSPLATLSLAVSAAGFLLAAVIDWNWLVEVSEANKPLAVRGSWLIGYVFLLATFLLYARHVVLEIEGVVVAPRPKRKRAKVKAAAEEAVEGVSAHPPQKSSTRRSDLDPVERPAPAAGGLYFKIDSDTSSSARDDKTNHGPLSRADRRKLRREAKMAS